MSPLRILIALHPPLVAGQHARRARNARTGLAVNHQDAGAGRSFPALQSQCGLRARRAGAPLRQRPCALSIRSPSPSTWTVSTACLLYTSDAADEEDSVDL